jgi:hypothetical protein
MNMGERQKLTIVVVFGIRLVNDETSGVHVVVGSGWL